MGTGKPRISTAVHLAGRVVQGELALGPVLAELELDPAAAEREPVPVVVELELGQAVAALELVIGPAVVPELETAQAAARELVTGLVAAL
jgi:hypothetical protein